mgnify:FL=1
MFKLSLGLFTLGLEYQLIRSCARVSKRQLAEPQNSAAARGAILAPAYHKHRRSEKTQDFWDGDGRPN